MINNSIEIWYWICMLALLICVVIYRGICVARNLWSAWKKRKEDLSHSS